MNRSNIEMRDAFLGELYKYAKNDRRVILVSDDFGAPSLDSFREDLPEQYINGGISEQNMVSVAAGLSLCGKLVYLYAITPFITLRCYEQLKLDICNMDLTVNIVGVGPGYGYGFAGPTHHAPEDIAVMRALPNLTTLSASDSLMAMAFAKTSYEVPGPKYIRLDRGKTPLIYENSSTDFSDGLTVIKSGVHICIISTGIMVSRAVEIAEELERHSISACVVDMYKLKPVNKELLLDIISETEKVVTLEEHLINGGVGSIVAEILVDAGISKPLKRIGIPDKHFFSYGSRQFLQSKCGLDAKTVTETVLNWI